MSIRMRPSPIGSQRGNNLSTAGCALFSSFPGKPLCVEAPQSLLSASQNAGMLWLTSPCRDRFPLCPGSNVTSSQQPSLILSIPSEQKEYFLPLGCPGMLCSCRFSWHFLPDIWANGSPACHPWQTGSSLRTGATEVIGMANPELSLQAASELGTCHGDLTYISCKIKIKRKKKERKKWTGSQRDAGDVQHRCLGSKFLGLCKGNTEILPI